MENRIEFVDAVDLYTSICDANNLINLTITFANNHTTNVHTNSPFLHPSPIIQEMMDSSYMEHDAYHLFLGVMQRIGSWYLSRDDPPPPPSLQKEMQHHQHLQDLLHTQPFAEESSNALVGVAECFISFMTCFSHKKITNNSNFHLLATIIIQLVLNIIGPTRQIHSQGSLRIKVIFGLTTKEN